MDTLSILTFLRQLQQNNEKAWMDAHRDDYQDARASFVDLITYLLRGLEVDDEGMRGLDPKRCIFRLNRDIRFSKDKSPYKTNFGAALSEGGRKSGNAAYYLHLQPHDESFIGGGIYQPPREVLAKVRQEIDYNASELRTIASSLDFKETFGEIQGDALKRAPKGYDPDHPNIELLKLKDYIVLRKLTDQEVTDAQFNERALAIFKTMTPFVHYLNVAVS
jgi:uncharacterized protein (TIGR02453 family)